MEKALDQESHAGCESQFLHLSNGTTTLAGVSEWRVFGVMVGRNSPWGVCLQPPLPLILVAAQTVRQRRDGSFLSHDEEMAE